MAQYQFRLPDIGEGIAEAEVVAWHVKPGERIAEDQAMVDVMTDKATVELSSPVTGMVIAVHGDVGERVVVGTSLIEIELDAALEVPQVRAPLASPATRHRAREMGVDLSLVTGTGPDGRVTSGDLDARTRVPIDAVAETKIIGVRRKIAEKMQESARRIPHFSYVEEFDLTELEALRAALNDERGNRPKLTLLPFFARALVESLPLFPSINAHYDDDAEILRSFRAVHIGVATQTGNGLMVPVVRHAGSYDLWQCAGEIARVTAAARDGRASKEELTGSTITISSLGALGGIAAAPVINRPEVAILAPNKMIERAVVKNGQIVIRKMMNLSTSFDHRIVDGHDAAQFVRAVKRLIECPALLFVERPRS